MISDLLGQVEKLRRARVAEAEALEELTRMTRADIREDLGEDGLRFCDQRATELLGSAFRRAPISHHVLLAALRDAWRSGAAHEARKARSGS